MDQKLEEYVEHTKERLRRLATSDSLLAVISLGLSDVQMLGSLSHLGAVIKDVQEMRDREDQLDISDIDNWRPEHRLVYELSHDAFGKSEAAFEAMLEACALIYYLINECDCAQCRSRRQKDKADLS